MAAAENTLASERETLDWLKSKGSAPAVLSCQQEVVVKAEQLLSEASQKADAAAAQTPSVSLATAVDRKGSLAKRRAIWLEKVKDRRSNDLLEAERDIALFRDLAKGLMEEANELESFCKDHMVAWDKANSSILQRMDKELVNLDGEINRLGGTAASADSSPPAPVPLLRPMAKLDDMPLPQDPEKVKMLASILTGLQHLAEQDGPTRVCWAHLIDAGLAWDYTRELLPMEVLGHSQSPATNGATAPSVCPSLHEVVPSRILAVLRRRLDGLAILWNVQMSTELQSAGLEARAQAFMDAVNTKRHSVKRPADNAEGYTADAASLMTDDLP
jgi:hypothetical protein